MMGDNTLWMPGYDHAGLATQIKVEEVLKKEEGKTRYDLGRENLLNVSGNGKINMVTVSSSS